jgi:hypothetical protein
MREGGPDVTEVAELASSEEVRAMEGPEEAGEGSKAGASGLSETVESAMEAGGAGNDSA